jgi:Cytochrome P460
MKLDKLRPTAIALLVLSALVSTIAAVADTGTPPVPYPRDFRSWHHVKSIVIGPEHRTFQVRGGIHHYYANDQAMKGYRTGTFPNGSVIVDEAVFTKDGENQAKGILLEADRRGLDVMVKNDRLHKDTGGWGFEHFNRDSATATLSAEARSTCEECHAKAKRDHVYSSVRP